MPIATKEDMIDMKVERCRSSKSSSNSANDPEIVRQRLLRPRPYQSSPIGNPGPCISAPRNTEKMFSFYGDLGQTVPAGRASEDNTFRESTASNESVQRARTCLPLKRWSTGPINPLWGNVVQRDSTPKSWSNFRSENVENSHATLLRSNEISPSRSMDAEGRDMYASRSQTVRTFESDSSFSSSQSIYDRSNLSPAMIRALRALGMDNQDNDGMDEIKIKNSNLIDLRANDMSSIITSPSASNGNSTQSDTHGSASSGPALASDDTHTSSSSPTPLRSSCSTPALSDEIQNMLLNSLSSPHTRSIIPKSLEGEFIFMKDTLNPADGVRVGFGGLSRLQEQVSQELVNSQTALALEFEFCTHGFDCVSGCDISKSKYYRKICFLIKRGKPRRGSFEIQATWLVGSVEYSVTLGSKLCTSKFPSGTGIAKRLSYALEGAHEFPPSDASNE